MRYSHPVLNAFATNAYSGGLPDANTVNATMIEEQLRIRMIRHIRTKCQERVGQTGIVGENRHIGAVEESFTRYHTVRNLSSILDL